MRIMHSMKKRILKPIKSSVMPLSLGSIKIWASKRATLSAKQCVCTEHQQHPVYCKIVAPSAAGCPPYFNFFGEKKSPPVERNNMMMVKNSQMLYRAKHRRKSPIKKVATIMSSTTQYYNIQHILGDRRWPSGNSNPFFREKKFDI